MNINVKLFKIYVLKLEKTMGLSIWHILLMMIVIILVFGTSKLKNLGKDLGGAIKDFRSSVNEENGTTSRNQKITDQDQENNKV